MRKIKEISVSITAGKGSEMHNHNLEYRKKLEHTCETKDKDAVIELIPYRDYRETINEIMKPHIDEYNRKTEERYQKAMERYNAGKIKNRPKIKDYGKMDYDYYTAHKDDTVINPNTKKKEQIPIFRSLIIGLGDKQDREQEHITQEQAVRIFSKIRDDMQKDFKDFKLLGFTIHFDESGYYHAHIDYKPVICMQMKRGLNVSTSQDTALANMGFVPEQSVINGRDKVPLLFNAMRNHLYRSTEIAMREEKLSMQYRATAVKSPGKDSGKNTRLEDWQQTQDAIKTIQHNKNIINYFFVKADDLPKAYKEIEEAFTVINTTFKRIEECPKARLNKQNIIVPYTLFSQLKSSVTDIRQFMVKALVQLKQQEEIREKNSNLENDVVRAVTKLKFTNVQLERVKTHYANAKAELERLEHPEKYNEIYNNNRSLDEQIQAARLALMQEKLEKAYKKNPKLTDKYISHLEKEAGTLENGERQDRDFREK